MANADEFGAELTDFRKRVEELRAARALPTGDRLATLDTALIELQYVADVLWPRFERLEGARRSEEGPSGKRERQLLKTLFQRLPVAVVVTDADAVVRRINVAASRLFGMRSGYATGRSLTASFRQDGRAVLRSHIAAVARGEGDRSLVAELLRDPARRNGDPDPARQLRVTLTAVRPSGERYSAVLAVFRPEAGPQHGDPPSSVPVPAVRLARPPRPLVAARRPDAARLSRHAELMDLVDDTASALLTAGAAGEDAALPRACRVLHGRFADWVVADLLPDGTGPLTRVEVLGPPDGGARAQAVAGQDPATAPLIREAATAGSCVLKVRPEDSRGLGDASDGAPLLALLEASSLLCVPLPLPSGAVLGVLTLIRSGARRTFELVEASAMDRISRHLALALQTARNAPRPS